MNNTSSIITIGREYGSGGRQIGKEIANYFGIKYYDKELLEHAANDSGICKELFEHHDEKPTNSFLYSLVMDTYSFGYSSAGFSDMPMNHKIFLAQFDAIKKLAGEGPCVMLAVVLIMLLLTGKTVSVFSYTQILTGESTGLPPNTIKHLRKHAISSPKPIRAEQVIIIITQIRNGDLPRATTSALTAASTESTIPSKRLSNLLKFLIQQKHLVKATYS